MADELNTPSTDVTSDVADSSAVSEERTEQEPSNPAWWQRLLGKRSSETEAEPAAQERGQSSTSTPKTRTVSEDELSRLVQAETDRRESKRMTEEQQRQRRELRDNDPWEFAAQERKAEQAQQGVGQLEQFLAGVGTEHDRVSIDPVVTLLPQAERDRIVKLDGAGRGLDGRKLIVTESLKALEKHWRSEGAKEAEGKLRRNPAFRKQLLSESRGGTTMEPELLPATGASTADQTVSNSLRSFYRLPGANGHNELG